MFKKNAIKFPGLFLKPTGKNGRHNLGTHWTKMTKTPHFHLKNDN